jgi:hypothetical protein
MHSETTLSLLDETFKKLAHQLCKFKDFTCAAFATVELLTENAARKRKAVHQCSGSNDPNPGSSG